MAEEEGIEWKDSSVTSRLRFLADQVGGPAALAGLVGMHRSSIFGYLSERLTPPPARLRTIAALYPCSIDWLEEGLGEPPEPDASRMHRAKEAAKVAYRSIVQTFSTADGRTWAGGTMKITSRIREKVRLEPTREQLKLALESKAATKIEEVLGSDLTRLVREGRACPSLEVLCDLERVLGPKLAWILGLED